jgi:hypothetical protein
MQAILLFRDEGLDWSAVEGEERFNAFFQKFVDWAEDLDKRGKLVGVESLKRAGNTVRRRGSGFVVDGPYAEGREAVLGYYIVQVADLAEAFELAKEAPHTQAGGATEVREIGPFPKPRQR